MQIKTKIIDTANASVEAKILTSDIKSKLEGLAKKAAKNMKIDGFRAGKVPVNVVLKRYEKELTSDAEQDALKEVIDVAIKDLKRNLDEIIGEPVVSKFDRNENEIDVALEISFKPVVNVDGYEKLIPEFSTPKVTKKEIDEEKSKILAMFAPLEKVEKESLQKGDFAKFDFEGFVDGVAFDGGKAENYVLEIGSGQFIPGFENVSVEKFEERLKDQIKADKHFKQINDELKPKFADAVVEKYSFDIPKNIVEQEIDMQFRASWSKFTPDEMTKFREDKDALTKEREKFREDAQKSVKLTFIIDELAKSRNIKVSDQELIQAVYFEAYRSGIDPKAHLESYKQQGILPAIKMSMIEEKMFNEMFALKSDEKKTSKKEKAE